MMYPGTRTTVPSSFFRLAGIFPVRMSNSCSSSQFREGTFSELVAASLTPIILFHATRQTWTVGDPKAVSTRHKMVIFNQNFMAIPPFWKSANAHSFKGTISTSKPVVRDFGLLFVPMFAGDAETAETPIQEMPAIKNSGPDTTTGIPN